MIYSKRIIIPANTSKKVPYTSQVDVVEGVIKRVWIRWNWGSACLAGLQVFSGGFQLWPTTARQWFHSSIHETTFEELYSIHDEPLHFVIKTYNLDDTFDHSVWVGFSVLRYKYGAQVVGLLDYLTRGGEA